MRYPCFLMQCADASYSRFEVSCSGVHVCSSHSVSLVSCYGIHAILGAGSLCQTDAFTITPFMHSTNVFTYLFIHFTRVACFRGIHYHVKFEIFDSGIFLHMVCLLLFCVVIALIWYRMNALLYVGS